MKNQVIEVLDREHGKKVIQYWKDIGVDTRGFEGVSTKADGYECRYYGVIDGEFGSYSLEYAIKHGAEIITLPEPEDEWKPKFGEKVLVWDNWESEAQERTFLFYEKETIWPVHVVTDATFPAFRRKEGYDVARFKHLKPLPTIKEVTMQEIADKFGVSVEQLKIKK